MLCLSTARFTSIFFLSILKVEAALLLCYMIWKTVTFPATPSSLAYLFGVQFNLDMCTVEEGRTWIVPVAHLNHNLLF